jgi:hypothetical protein
MIIRITSTHRKIDTIKVIKTYTDLGLRESKEIAEGRILDTSTINDLPTSSNWRERTLTAFILDLLATEATVEFGTAQFSAADLNVELSRYYREMQMLKKRYEIGFNLLNHANPHLIHNTRLSSNSISTFI